MSCSSLMLLLLLLLSSFYDSISGRKHFTKIKMQNERCWREVRKKLKVQWGGGACSSYFLIEMNWKAISFLANELLLFEICQVSCLKVKFIKCLNVKLSEQLTRESLEEIGVQNIFWGGVWDGKCVLCLTSLQWLWLWIYWSVYYRRYLWRWLFALV